MSISTKILVLLPMVWNMLYDPGTNVVWERAYDIRYQGDVVGSLLVKKGDRGERAQYSSYTKVNTKILFKKIRVRHKYKVSYEKGDLKSANVHIDVNDRMREETFVKKTPNGYRVRKVTDSEQKTVAFPIRYSTIMLYFKEPKGITTCFSEQTGTFDRLEKIGPGTYRKVNAKGRENTYHYQNGRLVRIEVDGGLIRFEMNLRD